MASENQLCGKGYELTLFLFTDILVVAKRKSNKTLSISRSPSTASLAGVGTLGHGQGLLQTKVNYHKYCHPIRKMLSHASKPNPLLITIADVLIWLGQPATLQKASTFPLTKGRFGEKPNWPGFF